MDNEESNSRYQLIENIIKFSDRTSKEELLNLTNNSIGNQKNKADKKILISFSEILISFLQGRITEKVFRFYLERQFGKENVTEYNNFLFNIKKFILNSYAEVNIENLNRKVNVIITTFNRKKYLTEAINSILNQSYPNIEVIVIDDASTDGTDELMKRKFSEISRIKYIKNAENQGPGNNRREAFKAHADGEFILFLDDDDYLIDCNYISKAVNFHINNPYVAFVAANVLLEYTEQKMYEFSELNLGEIVDKETYFFMLGKVGYPKPASTLTTLFKRKMLLEMDILNMEMVNDVSIYLRSLLVGDAGFIDTVAGVYRIHNNNITFSLSSDFLIENLNEKVAIKNLAREQYEEVKVEEWLHDNILNTVSYYFNNSAKKLKDYQSILNWVKLNSSEIYPDVKKKYRFKYIERKIKNNVLIKKLKN